MIALIWLLVLLVAFLAWCGFDAYVSTGAWEGERTASSFIKRFFRRHKQGSLLFGAGLAAGCVWLILHLVVQVA